MSYTYYAHQNAEQHRAAVNAKIDKAAKKIIEIRQEIEALRKELQPVSEGEEAGSVIIEEISEEELKKASSSEKKTPLFLKYEGDKAPETSSDNAVEKEDEWLPKSFSL